MKTLEELKQRVQREKQLVARLQLASARLEAAQQERIWALMAANEAGLSIRCYCRRDWFESKPNPSVTSST